MKIKTLTRKAKPPILPSRPADPTGVDALERKAMKAFARRFRLVGKAYIEALNRIPAQPVANKSYTYQLDPLILHSIMNQTSSSVDAILLQGGESNLWFFESYVDVAYRRGTAQSYSNLARQSSAYRGAHGTLRSLLTQEPYRRRIALLAAREFEEMKGLSNQVKADMIRVLTDGLGRGLNPRDIAQRLTKQTRLSLGRANRIARTEITTALRRARMDETQDANERYGLVTKEMHYSALSPTTRISHAERHGNLYTIDQQREWWSQDANSINCKCTSISILVDPEGKPLFPDIVKRARDTEILVKKEKRGPWKE